LLNGYPCCTANMHQGFPKFVQNLWYATPDNGLAVMLFSPSSVTAKVGDGTPVNIKEITDYPFSEKITLNVSTNKEVLFPLYIRIPSWCKTPSVFVNSKKISLESDSGLIRINRKWGMADKVEINFPMHVYLTSWYERSVAVERGPLVYALKMEENKRLKNFTGEDAKWYGSNYSEITSESVWNYALIECGEENIQKQYKTSVSVNIPLFPWNVESAPVKIHTIAKHIPNWKLYNESAGPLPYSIAYGLPVGEIDSIVMIPYGCTKLRVTEFPVTGQYSIK